MAKINHSTTLMINSEQRRTIKILDVKIDNITFQQALETIEKFVIEGRKSQKTFQITTINPEFVMEAQTNVIFKEALEGADLALPDGVGILWAGKYLKTPFKEKISGIDLIWQISKLAENREYRMFLLGAGEGIAEKTAQKLKEKYPKLKIVGTFAGSPDPKEAQAIIDLILEKKPDILFVAYGAPKQDIWIARHKLKYQVPLSMGVGGAFDMISEIIPRAPVWLRKIGLEWLWRFYKQPSRWKRIHRAVIRFPSAVINSKNK